MKDWELVSRIRRSPNKRKILKLLKERRPMTPTDIADELEIHRNNISEQLGFLRDKGFVKCLNPDDPHHRYYEITEEGKEILEKL